MNKLDFGMERNDGNDGQMSKSPPIPTIKEFFTGQTILVTGATGFMGKVLVEKLLRSCPGIERMFLIIREKKGLNIDERWKKVTDLPLFDRLKKERPGILEEKITLIKGDCLELDLGLSPEDKQTLEDNVSIIYHSAASVRFDDPLKKAVFMNTRSTRDVMRLALNMKKIKVFIHISTTYCNTDNVVLKEEVFPAHTDWRRTIDLAENYDENVINVLTSKYMGELPNTYTFTKSLAEHVVEDLGKGKIPCIIFRPSIVIASLHEPVPGWIDNFNGPVGLMVACGKGILRTSYCDPELSSDYIPVDIVVKSLVAATWEKGVLTDEENRNEITVYNSCASDLRKVSMHDVIEIGKRLSHEAVALDTILWYPGGSVTGSLTFNYIRVIFLHLLPALILEPILKLIKSPLSLLTIQRKIYIANMALRYFITHHWKFLNDRFYNLDEKILPDDQRDFSYNFMHVKTEDYFLDATLGAKKYLLKEGCSPPELERAMVVSNRMKWLDRIVTWISYYYIITYLLTWTWYILQICNEKFVNYIINL